MGLSYFPTVVFSVWAGLITGDVSNVTNSAEIYNPATGLWSVTANMITARSGFDPVVLANGKVLVAGGNAPVPRKSDG